ncbi:hypothetical protein, partial [Brevibacillus borstelensis]|uniref:hypothetical protein n=1 Tax=Brevibacillus borstelensis TaxID=45462 RepID=UPI001C82C4D4
LVHATRVREVTLLPFVYPNITSIPDSTVFVGKQYAWQGANTRKDAFSSVFRLSRKSTAIFISLYFMTTPR